MVVKLYMLPLLLLATMVFAAPLLHLDCIVDLTAALQRYYSSDCIFLVHDVENHQMSVRNSKAFAMVKKMLLYRGISVFTRVLGEGHDQPTCSLMIPLQMLFTSKTRLKYYRAKVSEALGLTNVRWLIWLEHNSSDSLDNIFEGINISYGSEVLVLQWTNSGAILTEVFRFKKDLPLQKLIFANWNRTEGLVTHDSNRLVRRSDFHGLTLDVAVLHEPPNTILHKETDRPLEVTGYYGQVWRILEQKLNFTSQYHLSPSSNYSSPVISSTWKEMIRMLQQGKVDVAVGDFSMTTSRVSVIDFALPLVISKTCMYVRKPDQVHVTWKHYLSPLDQYLWFATFTSVAVAMSIVWLIHRVTKIHVPSLQACSLDDTVFNSVAFLCQQFCVQSDCPSSCRVAVFGTYLTVVTVLASYSGSLTSFLTVLRYQLPFTSFQEFLERGSYVLELQRNSATNKHFLEANDSFMKAIFKSQILPKMASLPQTVREGMENLCRRKSYAWMTTRSAVESMNEALNCSIDVISRACYRSTNTIALPKNSPYKAIINYNIQLLRRFGILNKLYMDEFPRTFPRIEEREVKSIELSNVAPLLTVLFTGLILAVMVLSMEVGIGRIIQRNTRNKRRTRLTKRLRGNHSVDLLIRS